MKQRAFLGPGERRIIAAGLLAVAVSIAFQIGERRGLTNVRQLPPITDTAFAATLMGRYGPTRNSEDLEEWIVRDFFKDERDGVFLDVGANHHQERSNTYYLETALNWSGVAIDALPQFADGYSRFRPRTVFLALFVSDVDDSSATLYVPTDGHHRVSSQDRGFAESFGSTTDAVSVRTVTLDTVLSRTGVKRLDFLNMDIELAEPKALAGFSIDRFKPRLACIEAHAGVRQQILDYFVAHGYALITKYLGVDRDNYWFAPLGSIQDEPGGESHPHS
jgi:FkbM family methyltransferase